MNIDPSYTIAAIAPFKKRIDNIEVRNFYLDKEGIPRSIQSHLNIVPFSYFEIVRYYPNKYFGKEDQYVWVKEYAVTESSFKIHKDLFLNKEHSYTLASWGEVSFQDELKGLMFIGDRPFELDESEFNTFCQVARIGQEYLNNLHKEISENLSR